MTKKLEDILNLPNVKEAFAKIDEKEKTKSDEAGENLDNIENEEEDDVFMSTDYSNIPK